MQLIAVTLLGFGAVVSWAIPEGPKYAYETILLTPDDIGNFTDIRPATTVRARCKRTECRAFPGSDDWPEEAEWQRFNSSLGGALLKPVPAGAVCYPGPYQDAVKCSALASSQTITRAFFEDPISLSTQWTADNACNVVQPSTGQCIQGGLPTYVVNATTVKQIQIAVNFARNKNLRLVIRNTGHDFVGRSTGAGALSIWVHYLDGFTVLPDFTVSDFRGKAVHAGVSLEAWEVHAAMVQYGINLVAPSFSTVGAFGGYMAAGGHSTLTSYHGLGSDQVLSLNVVTADGSFVTASPDVNSDLFFALRGGGGGTFGIVTSVVVKTHAPVNVSSIDIAISSLDTGADLFWKAMEVYFIYESAVVDAGGVDRTYIYPLNNSTVFNFTTKFEFPGKTGAEVLAFAQTLATSLASIGVNITLPPPKTAPWATQVLGEGAPIRDERFASRLIPRAVWDDPAKYSTAMAALRKICEEGGYQFHGTAMAPSLKLVGYPGNTSAANPAFRDTVMHFVVYDSFKTNAPGVTAAEDLAARARLSRYTDYIRAATPGSGSYINEADVVEPDWQRSFFGSNYQRLAGIKKKWDPWGLFWAPATVGSEGWAVRTADGKPTQNGKLCRVPKA